MASSAPSGVAELLEAFSFVTAPATEEEFASFPTTTSAVAKPLEELDFVGAPPSAPCAAAELLEPLALWLLVPQPSEALAVGERRPPSDELVVRERLPEGPEKA